MKVLIAVLCLLVAGIQSKAETSEKKYEKTYPKAGIEELVLSNQYGKMFISIRYESNHQRQCIPD